MIRQVIQRFQRDRAHLFFRPAQEQLVSHIGIDAPHQTLDVFGAHGAIVQETARDQRRQRHQVQHVVAEVSQQHGVLLRHLHDIAELMFESLDHAHALAMAHDRRTIVLRDPDQRRIRRLSQQ